MITSFLLDRELNINNKYNSFYYSGRIVRNYFESLNYLHRHEIKLKTYGYRSFFSCSYNVEFNEDGNYMATVHNHEFKVWNLNSSIYNLDSIEINKASNFVKDFSFNRDASKIAYGGENLTNKNYGLHVNDIVTGEIVKSYLTHNCAFSLTSNPLDPNIITFTDSYQQILQCDLRSSVLNKIKVNNLKKGFFFCSLQYHPVQENLMLTSCESKENQVFTFDLRNNQIIMNYKLPYKEELNYIKACYNKKGTKILVSIPSKRPLLFDFNEEQPLYEFDDFGYYNSDWVKSCCFMGIDNEYIASGSQNSNTYVWKIPKDDEKDKTIFKKINKAKFILKGHTNEVNVVCYNNSKFILASIGVGRLLLWSCFPFISCDDHFNLLNIIKHETTPPFDHYSDDINIIKNDFTFHLTLQFEEFYRIPKFNDGYNLKKILNSKAQLEKFFQSDSTIRLIHSYLINYKNDGKLFNLDLLNKLKKNLQDNLNNLILNSEYLSIIFEIKKVFVDKFKIMSFVNFLKLHIKLAKKTKKKLIIVDDKKSTTATSKRLKSLKKIILIMKVMVYDMIVIFKLSKELYEVSLKVLKKLLTPFDDYDEFISIELSLKKSIFKDNNDGDNETDENNLNKIDSFFIILITSYEKSFSRLNEKYITSCSTNFENKTSCSLNRIFKVHKNLNTVGLNLFQHYNDDILLELDENESFKQDFKKKISFLK